MAEKVARARYLLDSASHVPVIFRNDTPGCLRGDELVSISIYTGSSAPAASQPSVDQEHDKMPTHVAD